MLTTAANFILALLEERPVAASRILRDAGGPKDLSVQGLQKRLGEAIERRELQAQADLSNSILTDSLRIEFHVEDSDELSRCIHAGFRPEPTDELLTKIAEEAFEAGRRAVESIIELHATQFAHELEDFKKPTFLEVNAI